MQSPLSGSTMELLAGHIIAHLDTAIVNHPQLTTEEHKMRRLQIQMYKAACVRVSHRVVILLTNLEQKLKETNKGHLKEIKMVFKGS